MTPKSFWRGVLIAVLSLGLAAPAPANQVRVALHPHLLAPNSGSSFQKTGEEIVIGIVVVAVAIGVLVTVLIVHHKSQKRPITGCVHPVAAGMSVTDEKDKRSYALSGDTTGVKPGDRMTLEGKVKHTGTTLVFETRKVIRDFGACQS